MNEKQAEAKAITPYDNIVGETMNRIVAMQKGGQIHFPKDYSPQNALQSAWLILQGVKNKADKPVLDEGVCTKASIANSLLDMVVSGLNPAKDQGYFIAYGKLLTWSQSYFGAMAVAKRVDPRIAEEGIIAEIIYEKDELVYEIKRGQKEIVSHKQTLESVKKGDIKGAYCMVISKDGEILKTEIMAFEEIKKSWSKSQMKPIDEKGNVKPGSNHAKHPVEFCKRTVINRACKPIINSSSDRVLLESVKRAEFVEVEHNAAMQIEENANKETIDIDPVDTVEERKAAGEMTSIEPEDDLLVAAPETSTPERRAFTDDIRKAANIIGLNKYKEILGQRTIGKIPEEEFDSIRKKFKQAVDEMSEELDKAEQKPGF
ncbi:hypothetical protein LCGC14_0701540 [marine sediment metagenome]|uniref:Uncharacterized protein n=1 Tax=marine sediment metagenome TaxID=412755 RepID=A0A0F9T3G5_9ZZZZ